MLDGKVAIVTGAGGGIGRAIAIGLARAGAAVVINDLGVSLSGDGGSASPAEGTLAEITSFGGRAIVNTDSVGDWDSAQRIVETARREFGGLHIVVNNAGILRDAMFHKMEPADWLSVLNVHLNGTFFVSRAAAPLFREQSGGSYVHMTSASGLVGNVGQANYSTAKLGIVALSKSIALDLARYNVRSNCICPFCLGKDDREHSSFHPGSVGSGRATEADDTRKECAAGRLSGIRRITGRVRSGFRRAHE